ncbi:thiolase domain-containing protein [Halanaerobacter jeridensis]|uniref:Acetyl-CoA C-acetyltransferase n=1 Tax=Halanaerobacter jeridensis TaxID=706427 RepID=A0A939BQY3_9FIRM|nr:thiolase domain-containing protein [Halanaerobacter jeridensis]MBM7556824.1 acetyl-CoA C-acetyltransferase [Halanaerobacter jeridensis]
MSVSVIGTYHSKVGNLDKDLYELIEEVGQGVLEDAPVEAADIGQVFVGNYSSGGFNNQEHLAPYTVNIDPDLRFTPATKFENACASGSAAIEAAVDALEAGKIDYALVLGAEKMTSLDTKGVTKTLGMASYWPTEGSEGMTFPGLFAEFAKGYRERYDLSDEELSEILAKIAAKNYNNALANPLAQMPMDCTYQDILDLPDEKNPVVAPPLRLNDCSLVSDGAAALVLTRTEEAKGLTDEVVEISSLVHTTDYLEIAKRSNSEFVAGKKAVEQAYQEAGITVDDLDFAEVHDCFTIAELLAYETLGLADDGEGAKLLDDGTVDLDGELPINASGGLKAKGHPVGATGVSMAVLAARQLLNNSIGNQIEGAETGMTFNIGGSAASNYALVFKKLK